MAETKIEWTVTPRPDGTLAAGYSFNPWVGCTRVSNGCDNCYAEAWAKRSGRPQLWTGAERQRTTRDYWRRPLLWNRDAKQEGVRRKVFCASLADVFDNQALPEWRDDLWELIADTYWLDWLLLTKRPQNIRGMLPPPKLLVDRPWPWPNVWLGCTAEDQEQVDLRVRHLVATPAVVHFLSVEPMLGPVNLQAWLQTARNFERRWWVICGGESGPHRREMNLDWARDLRDQCRYEETAYFFKQVDKIKPVPPDLKVRQFPYFEVV